MKNIFSEFSSRWAWIIICSAGIAFSALMVFFMTLTPPDPIFYSKLNVPASAQDSQNLNEGTPVVSITVPEEIISGLPIRLKIPKIRVDAAVVYVGITSDGAMDVPKGPDDVAWFNLGPRPGEIGSAVIAGHYGWKDRIPAVFDNLHTMAIGDTVSVVDEKGATTTFVVHELRTFGKNDNAASVFASSDGKAHLNLITCVGKWSKAQQSYSNRLVVFTNKRIE